MKKRIVISNYDNIYNTNYGGGGAIALDTVAGLLTGAYDVTIVTGRYRNAKNLDRNGVHYKFIGTNLHPLFDQAFFHIAIILFARKNSFDVWLENFTPPCITGGIVHFTRKPVIGLAHMIPGKDMERKYLLPFHLLDIIGLHSYKSIIATSRYFGSYIRKYAKKAAVHVIPNGVDVTPLRKEKAHHILWIGRIEIDQKGIDLLLDAYGEIFREVGYKLVIAGAGTKSQVNKLHKLISINPAKDNIEYVSKVGYKQKSGLYSRAAAVIVSSRFETFSMVAAEAMAAKTPLITFDIGGLKWIPRDVRAVASSMTAKSLAHQIRKTISDTAATQARVEVAYNLVKSMTWESTAQKYAYCIEEVLK